MVILVYLTEVIIVKKCQELFVLVFIINIIINHPVVYAAEDLHNVCNSYGEQEALLVGKVEEITLEKGIMKVKIVRLVSGMLKYKDNFVTINFNKLDKLDTGDEILLSLKSVNPDESLYKVAYERACYFVQCMDDKKIKIMNTIYFDSYDMDYFDIILQWYCNTGEILTEEDLSNTIKYYRWVGGKKELVYDQSKDIWYQDSFTPRFSAPDVIQKKNRVISVCAAGVLALLLLATAVVFLVVRHPNPDGKE